ncbi:MAG: hypothetical protein WC775_03935 [Patescibacteria group bacterium]|jgi:hypothetical protein
MSTVLAQLTGNITRPDFLAGNLNLMDILGWIIRLFFIGAGLMVVYNLLYGGFEWIQSTGDKEKVAKARNRITNALIGFVILFATVAIIIAIEQIFSFGLGFTRQLNIPRFGNAN